MKLLINGAGIGGMVAALALRQRGFTVEVHEAASHLGEVGAGLMLSRGSQQVFRALGIQDQVAALACPYGDPLFLHYRSGRVLTGVLDQGDGAADDGVLDIPRQIHRADLHRILVKAYTDGGSSVALNHRLTGVHDSGSDVTVQFANGDTATSDVLIGADGVRSAVRDCLGGTDEPRFTGQAAYRFLVPIDKARKFMNMGRSAIYIGPNRTFNRYTVRGGSIVNCVCIISAAEWTEEGWSTPATRDEVLAAFDGWHPDVLGLMAEPESCIKWGIFDRVPLTQWAKGRVTLLGDAAHAMLPFLGMGAAMAIEDGMVLARAFDGTRSIREALARYEMARKPRTAMLHAKSVEQGVLIQGSTPADYDGASSPASDSEIVSYDPVTSPI